jgi:hypothetical protein
MGSKLIAKEANGTYDFVKIENKTRESLQIIKAVRR